MALNLPQTYLIGLSLLLLVIAILVWSGDHLIFEILGFDGIPLTCLTLGFFFFKFEIFIFL